MTQNSISSDAFLARMEARLDCNHTEEQLAFIKHMTRPAICFASPGTGKTTTAISGLLYTELFEGVPGENIYALSFTNMATAELAVRHKKACDKLGVPVQTITFKTLHSLCAQVLKDNYRLLGMNKLDTTASLPMSRAVQVVVNAAKERGETLTTNTARNIVRACRDLNASLIFDEDHVKTKKSFKDTKVSYELFTGLRQDLYTYSKLTETIPVDSIMLYTLQLMTEHPEVSQEFKKKCKVMLVDEAQDLSLLHLRIISLMTDCPILIGDMKQQIYAFNGACQEIVEQYYNLYPEADTLELNQSFRCKDEIIDYAASIIEPNRVDLGHAVGKGHGGTVQLIDDLSLEDLAESLHEDYFVKNRNMFSRDIMFLFRNNASAIPIAEALFNARVPFRVNKFQSATELPVIKEMVELLTLCRNPYNMNYVNALSYLIPELRSFKDVTESPFYSHLKSGGISVFEVNYIFKDMGVGGSAMQLLSDLSEKIRQGVCMRDLMNDLYPMYYSNYLKQREWMLEYPAKYYIRLVQSLFRNKTFDKFVADEAAKKQFIDENVQLSRGVRCYTMHAAKGLEADDIYILDADEGIVPNLNKLNDLVKCNCNMDAAREVRNERSLCYVAVTRAKDNVFIVYNGTPASMLMGDNQFNEFDELYTTYNLKSDDINAFSDFLRSFGGN